MDIYLAITNTVGFASLAAGLIYIGRKLQKLDTLQIALSEVEEQSDYLARNLHLFKGRDFHEISNNSTSTDV